VARSRGIDRRSRDGGRAACRRASVTLTPPLVVLDRGRVVSEISPKDMTVPELTEYLIALQHQA
jgi:hypothetical protein